MKTKNTKEPTFAEITKPLKEAAKKAGMKEEDVVDLIHKIRREKRAKEDNKK